MITMQKSWEYKKKLLALPGREGCDHLAGNYHLIKQGKAHQIENCQEILTHF
jgi:predicted Rossmann fold nucleotide-binding protein DprA/Smf involved in DNA uptake